MAVHGGKLYTLGGFDGANRLSSVEAYDPFHNRWTQVILKDFEMRRRGFTLEAEDA